jgi:hypothetical protein
MYQQGPCAGKAARLTPDALVGDVVTDESFTVVVGADAPDGKQTCIPGNSGVEADALLAANNDDIDTDALFAIAHHESPDTTSYGLVHAAAAADRTASAPDGPLADSEGRIIARAANATVRHPTRRPARRRR